MANNLAKHPLNITFEFTDRDSSGNFHKAG